MKSKSYDISSISKRLAELRFEVGDAPVRGGELSGTILDLALELRKAVGGLAEQLDLLAQLVDLAGPAGLVMLLAVLGEPGAFKGGGEFGVQVGVGGPRRRGGQWCRPRSGGHLEEPIDPAHAAAEAETALEFGAQRGAGEHSVVAAQIVDQRENCVVRQAGRAGHTLQDS